jgi:hypothetical protein
MTCLAITGPANTEKKTAPAPISLKLDMRSLRQIQVKA